MSIAFPTNPTVGQVYQRWIWNGQAWTTAASVGVPAVLGVQVFTANGTYIPNPAMAACMIECVGGGSGGNAAAAAANYYATGGGGGSGGYSRKYATAAMIGSSQPVTVGAGGVGGIAASTLGAAGGDTSVGTLCIARGSPASNLGSPSGSGYNCGPGGPPGVGDVTVAGNPGTPGGASPGGTTTVFGVGGASVFGGAGAAQPYSAGANLPGLPGRNYGGGGGGASSYNSVVVQGVAGGNGVVVITEYSAGQGPPGPPGPPGALTLLNSQQVTSPVSYVSFALPANLNRFKLIVSDFKASAGGGYAGLQFSTDGGSTWLTPTAYSDNVMVMQVGSTAATIITHNGTVQIYPFGGVEMATATAAYLSAEFDRPLGTILAGIFASAASNGAGAFSGNGSFWATGAGGVNMVRILNTVGNITQGLFALYGWS
jgi:hypothetical protein